MTDVHEIQITTNTPKKTKRKFRFPTFSASISLSFFPWTHFLPLPLSVTHCLISNLSQSPSQYSWWFHTFFNDLSAPHCRSISTHPLRPKWAARCKGVCQNNVRKKQIFPNIYISYILWGEIFVKPVWVRNWHTFSFSPPFLHITSITSTPNSTIKMITKHTP